MQDCHHGFKTKKAIDKALELDKVCEYCGGDPRKPTGLEYIGWDE